MSAPVQNQAAEIATLKVQVRELREFHAGDLFGNSCFWIFLIALFVVGIVFIFVWPYHDHGYYHPHAAAQPPPNASFYMKLPVPLGRSPISFLSFFLSKKKIN